MEFLFCLAYELNSAIQLLITHALLSGAKWDNTQGLLISAGVLNSPRLLFNHGCTFSRPARAKRAHYL